MTTALQDRRALVVADDRATLLHAATILRQAGLGVQDIRQSQTALALIESETYDLLLLEIELPGLDGIELLRHLRARGSDAPVLLLTSSPGIEQLTAALPLGIGGLLTTPLDAATLLAAATDLLQRSQERRLASFTRTLRPLLALSQRPASLDLPAFSTLLLGTVTHEIGAEQAALLLLTDKRLELIALAGQPLAQPVLLPATHPAERAMQQRTLLALGPGQLQTTDLGLAGDEPVQHTLLAPLLADERVLGVLLAARIGRSDPFSASECELFELLAQQASGVLAAQQQWSATRRSSAESQRAALRQAQAERMGAVARLATAIAHEVNNPLQAIHNSLHLLLSRSLATHKEQRYLELAQQEVEGLIGLVRRTLDMHQPGDEGLRLVAVQTVVEGALAAAAPGLAAANIVVSCEWAPELLCIRAIASHVKQALLNIVLNATEAMAGGGTLAVRTALEYAEETGNQLLVLIEIRDTAGGIDPEAMAYIFEPFYSTKSHNPGLGLTISYNIIARHGGELRVGNNGAGAVFTIRLPAAAE